MPRNAKRHQIEHLFSGLQVRFVKKKEFFPKVLPHLNRQSDTLSSQHPTHTFLPAGTEKKAADQPLRQSAAYNKKGMYYLMKCFISSKADVALPVALSNIEALYHESVTRFVVQSSPYSLASIHHQKSPVTLS